MPTQKVQRRNAFITRLLKKTLAFKRKGDPRWSKLARLRRGVTSNMSTRRFNTVLREFNSIIRKNKQLETLEDFNKLFSKKKVLTDEQFDKLLELQGDKQIFFKIITNDGNVRKIPLTVSSMEFLQELITNRYFEQQEAVTGSDTFDSIYRLGVRKIQAMFFTNNGKKRENKNGAYFNKRNNTDIDLTRYQILRKNDDEEIINEHCFIHSLKMSGLGDDKLNIIKLHVKKGVMFSRKHIQEICNMLKIKVVLYFKRNAGRSFETTKTIYGNKYDDVYYIALYNNHYFIYENVDFSVFYIKNYQTCVKNKYPTNTVKIVKTDKKQYPHVKDDYKKIDSLQMIYLLDQQDLFTYYISKTHYNKEADENVDLLSNTHEINECQRLVTFHEKTNKNMYVFYADCESDVVTEDQHIPILIGVVDSKNSKPALFTNYGSPQRLVDNFLRYIKNNSVVERDSKTKRQVNKIICYFHNLKYDYFGLLQKYCKVLSTVQKEGVFYRVNVLFYGVTIEFRDSYKMINVSLSKFPDMLGLPVEYKKKEAIGYTYHTIKNISKVEKIHVDEYYKHVHKTSKEDFIKILKENSKTFKYDDKTQTFYPHLYYKHYLKWDCLVLREGLKYFNNIIKNITSKNDKTPLTVFNYLTISSLTDAYFGLNGTYDNVYEMRGVLREFCSKAVFGGRVAVNQKYKKQVINKRLADFDGVSLYPSSIDRLCKEQGLPTGKCKRIGDFQEVLNSNKYFIVKIKLISINKSQQIPFIGIKKDGITQYVNNIIEPVYLTVDRITLEDYINFHDIDYEFVSGVYWFSETFNKTMGVLINELFQSRLHYKKLMKSHKKGTPEHSGYNALQSIIKLMMNSSYGKTCIRKTDTKVKYMRRTTFKKQNNKWVRDDVRDAVDEYIYSNFKDIKEFRDITDDLVSITESHIDDSYNRCHIGTLILSYSKRIMNEVMDTANSNNIIMYYTDTDSQHLPADDVNKLAKLYEEKYNKVLIGKNLGQFHTDFDMTDSVTEPVSIQSIFLGKKCYVDKLQGQDENGNAIYDYHVRLKGISKNALQYECDKHFKGDYLKMYEHLINNKIEFVLNPYDYNPSFEYTKCGIRTRERMSFKRVVCF
jgi:hypothetical protein